MSAPSPFYREAGAGPAVVCLHANASSAAQWRPLQESLAQRFHVLAADSYGAGKSPPWPGERQMALSDEVALLEPVFQRAGDAFALVGHSYGAALALRAALAQPQRVRALVLYEPTLFNLLDAERPAPNAADGIRATVARAVASLAAGDPDAAAECFIDYWMGPGTWAATAASRRGPILASIVNVRGWADALFGEPTSLDAWQQLQVPVLYLVGRQSPVSAREVARLLAGALPQVQLVELAELGHMGPITHPERVNPLIADFLQRHCAA